MIYSHTLVRNGQPFINLVLRQAEPFMDKMLITLSEKSDDGTKEIIQRFTQEFPDKVEIYEENVAFPGYLTYERQRQLDNTPNDAWVLFLDDDDYWPTSSLQEVIDTYLKLDIDALAFSPYQLVDDNHYDLSWQIKWFTKWFKKQPGVHYRYPWPKDVIYKDDHMLYWKKSSRVKRVDTKYFHLSNIKNNSFRKEPGFEEYDLPVGVLKELPQMWENEVVHIYDEHRKYR